MCLRWTAAGMLEAETRFAKSRATAGSHNSPSRSNTTSPNDATKNSPPPSMCNHPARTTVTRSSTTDGASSGSLLVAVATAPQVRPEHERRGRRGLWLLRHGSCGWSSGQRTSSTSRGVSKQSPDRRSRRDRIPRIAAASRRSEAIARRAKPGWSCGADAQPERCSSPAARRKTNQYVALRERGRRRLRGRPARTQSCGKGGPRRSAPRSRLALTAHRRCSSALGRSPLTTGGSHLLGRSMGDPGCVCQLLARLCLGCAAAATSRCARPSRPARTTATSCSCSASTCGCAARSTRRGTSGPSSSRARRSSRSRVIGKRRGDWPTGVVVRFVVTRPWARSGQLNGRAVVDPVCDAYLARTTGSSRASARIGQSAAPTAVVIGAMTTCRVDPDALDASPRGGCIRSVLDGAFSAAVRCFSLELGLLGGEPRDLRRVSLRATRATTRRLCGYGHFVLGCHHCLPRVA
jgi:hypothetical protein